MLRITFLLCLLACGLCYGQQTSPMEILFKEQLPLRKQVRVYPEAQKAFNHYRLKIISGSVVGTSGVILLNHSLGSISPRQPTNGVSQGLELGLSLRDYVSLKAQKKAPRSPRHCPRQKKSPLTIILAV